MIYIVPTYIAACLERSAHKAIWAFKQEQKSEAGDLALELERLDTPQTVITTRAPAVPKLEKVESVG